MRGPATRTTAAILAAGPLARSPLEAWALIPAPLFPPTISRRVSSLPRTRGLWSRRQRWVFTNTVTGVNSVVVDTRAGAASRGDPDGRSDRRPTSNLDIDPDILARACEAALNDDYAWYMEFIEGTDKEDVAGGVASNSKPSESSVTGASSKSDEEHGSERFEREARGARDSSTSRESIGYGNVYGEGQRRGEYYHEKDQESWSPSLSQSYNADGRRRGGSRGYSPATSGGDGRKQRRRALTPADTAYDYDFDDEFAEEEGQGGWSYDTDLTLGVAERRRDVDVKKVRSRARIAAQRRPLPVEPSEDDTAATDCIPAKGRKPVTEGGTGARVSAVISPDKASVLTGDLGYTDDEVSRMDPDMAELAVQRRLRRPASGMPLDWAAGSPESPIPDEDSEDFPGALDLDEMLSSGGPASATDRRYGDPEDQRPPRERPRSRTGRMYHPGDGDDGGYYGSSATARRPAYYDEREAAYDEGPGGYSEVPSRRLDRGGEGSETTDRRRRRRALDPAEKYERRLRGWDDEEERSIWTGVGDEGPWPSLEEFTKLLREETDVRLSLVGPWAADIVAAENNFRLNAYSKWLEVLDKGVGQTLLEAGFFDPRSEDDDFDDDDYDDGIYAYDGDGRSRRGDYNYRGRKDGRGFDSAGGADRGDRERPRPRRRRADRRPPADGRPGSSEGFDIGSFLRSSAEKLASPASGMEEQAARFEREYPGRRRQSPLRDTRDIPFDDSRSQRLTAEEARRRGPSGREEGRRERGSPTSARAGDRGGFSGGDDEGPGEVQNDNPY